ncbi:MAG: DUF4260 domain-containing protein [Gemmatimonadetes bacterium]|nr:DUF4260 domain-containing protein [Gemmatimonadota bacterium]
MTAVQGSVRSWLRVEGLAVLIASVALYRLDGGGWAWFFLFLLLPDLSMLGYLAGPRAGATTYNAVHSYAAPLLLALMGVGLGSRGIVALGLIWTAHIGLDRVLGFGLKYPTAFGDTHLGHIGKNQLPVG